MCILIIIFCKIVVLCFERGNKELYDQSGFLLFFFGFVLQGAFSKIARLIAIIYDHVIEWSYIL